MSQIKNYDELRAAVDGNGGVIVETMGTLRDVHGAGKLGVNVVNNIKSKLDSMGIGSSPPELPTEQWKMIILYRKGSVIAKIVESITDINPNTPDILKEFSTNNAGAIETINKIKEIICD